MERVIEVEHATPTPTVFGTNGGLGRELKFGNETCGKQTIFRCYHFPWNKTILMYLKSSSPLPQRIKNPIEKKLKQNKKKLILLCCTKRLTFFNFFFSFQCLGHIFSFSD